MYQDRIWRQFRYYWEYWFFEIFDLGLQKERCSSGFTNGEAISERDDHVETIQGMILNDALFLYHLFGV